MDSPIKTYFPTNTIYKFITFISAIVLIFSLFIDVKVLSNDYVLKLSLGWLIAGIGLWFVHEVIEFGVERYFEFNYDRYSDFDGNPTNDALSIMTGWRIFLYVLIGATILFGIMATF